MPSKKTKEPTANPVGRPSEFKPEYCAELIAHMEEGLSFEAFGGVIRKAKQTLYNWLDEYPEFLDARHIGESLGRLYYDRLGRDHMVNRTDSVTGQGSTSTSLNSTVYNLVMLNRFGLRTKHSDDVPQVNLNVGNLSEGELVGIVNEYLKNKGKSE